MEPITMKVINPGVKRSRKQDTQLGVGAGRRARRRAGLEAALGSRAPAASCQDCPLVPAAQSRVQSPAGLKWPAVLGTP